MIYRDFAEWLSVGAAAGRLRPHDSDAVAAVLLSALSYHRVLDLCLGVVPGDAETERFVRAWSTLAGALVPNPATGS